MTIQVHDTGTDGAYLQRVESGASLYIGRDELPQVLEDVARILGYTLIDREERRELLGHVTAGVPDNVEGARAAYEALAAAVTSALRDGEA